jgi:hypothetical protein
MISPRAHPGALRADRGLFGKSILNNDRATSAGFVATIALFLVDEVGAAECHCLHQTGDVKWFELPSSGLVIGGQI